MLSEAVVQQRIRIAAPQQGVVIWRNNVGACETKEGRQIRYGLANDSMQINRVVKSADLIGITPMLITPEMVGRTVGVFTSIEAKREGWKYSGNPRELAQNKWSEIVRQHGGFSCFATGPHDIWPGTGV